MKPIFVIAALVAIAACNKGSDDNFAIDETNTANAEIETLPPDETVSNEADDSDTGNNVAEAAAGSLLIPAAFRGRWGMVPDDCTSTRGDAKGLIIVDENSIKFFESDASLTKVTGNSPENFTGTFAFSGEGENWTNTQNLKLTGSSNTLVRKQSDITQPFTYKRCA